MKDINIKFDDLPLWFKNKKIINKYRKEKFLKNFIKEPSLHLVFKDSDKLKRFEEKLFITSEVSGF